VNLSKLNLLAFDVRVGNGDCRPNRVGAFSYARIIREEEIVSVRHKARNVFLGYGVGPFSSKLTGRCE